MRDRNANDQQQAGRDILEVLLDTDQVHAVREDAKEEFSPVHTPLPISLTIDTGAARTLSGLTYQPRLDGDVTGTITGYTVEVSIDGITYTLVATGTWAGDSSIKSAAFSARAARYLRLTATSAINNYASAAEVVVADIPGS